MLNTSGKAEEALQAREKAALLDPVREDSYEYALGDALVEMGRYEQGITFLKRHLAAHPDTLIAHTFMIVADAELGRDRDARS